MSIDPAAAAADRRTRGAYRAWIQIPIRFSDQDALGHVNNAAIAVYFEQSRCETLLPLVHGSGVAGLDFVLARIVIDYLQEIRYPGVVDVGLTISRFGTKSLVLSSAVFAGASCCVLSEATVVFFDTLNRKSAVPPAALIDSLARFR